MVKQGGHIIVSLLIFFFLWCDYSSGKGYYYTRSYTTRDYNAEPQNWSIAQDKRGVVYVANNEGVLEYDGTHWRKYELPGKPTCRSLVVNDHSRVYVGAKGDFGYFTTGSFGKRSFVSLKNKLPNEEFEGEIWDTDIKGNDVFFLSKEKLFIYNEESEEIIALEPPGKFLSISHVKGRIFIAESSKGLWEYVDDQLVQISGIPENKYLIYNVFAQGEDLYFLTKKHGFFKLLPNGVSLVSSPLNTNFENNYAYSAVALSDTSFACAIKGKGITVLHKSGKALSFLDKKSGIKDVDVNHLFLDRNRNLWASLGNGITLIDLLSPITRFGEESELYGSIQDVEICYNRLYIGTSAGLFYLSLDHHESIGNLDEPDVQNEIIRISDLEVQIWDLKTVIVENKEFLFVCVDEGTKILTPDNQMEVASTGIPWMVYQSKLTPDVVYLSLIYGIEVHQYIDKEWKNLGLLPNFSHDARVLEEDGHGNLWVGNDNGELFRLTPGSSPLNFSVMNFDSSKGINLPNGAFPVVMNKQVFCYSETGLLFFDQGGQKFVHALQDREKQFPGIHRVSYHSNPKIPTAMVRYNEDELAIGFYSHFFEGSPFRFKPFHAVSEELIHGLIAQNQHIFWMGGINGLFRIDLSKVNDINAFFSSSISSIRLNTDSILYHGASTNSRKDYLGTKNLDEVVSIDYEFNNIRFDVSAQFYKYPERTKYSYFLEGFDNSWSDWSTEAFVNYTNLKEGFYVFRTKAKNAYGEESIEVVYSIKVNPPWYRTPWAYTLYFISLILIIWVILVLYTRRLIAVQKKLERIVEERTSEIRLKNEKLEEANVKITNQKLEVEKQKEEIEIQKNLIEEKNLDIMDSLSYAERIQKALLQPGENINKLLGDHFMFFQPRDIVSGDFYWTKEEEGFVYIAVADCTGHGVPGAFMSMLGISFLNEIMMNNRCPNPADMMNILRERIIEELHQTGEKGTSLDGMDMVVYKFDMKKKQMWFSGANNPLWIIRPDGGALSTPSGELIETRDFECLREIRADKQPVAIYEYMDPFTDHFIQLNQGDRVFGFTDGYADQFGGPNGKKYKYQSIKKLLVENITLSMADHESLLLKTWEEWRGEEDQIDDMCIFGLEISQT